MIGLALRTTQDSLGLDGEIERYRDYHASMKDLLWRFDSANSLPAEAQIPSKLLVMEDVERLAFEEFRSFVRAQNAARFVL